MQQPLLLWSTEQCKRCSAVASPQVRPLLLCFAGCLVQARAGVCICCWQKSRHFEYFENTTFLEKKDPLHPLPSVHVAEERVMSSPVPRRQPMSDASRLWSFGGRPSDIPDFLGLDNPDFSKDLAYVHALWAICQLHGTASGSSVSRRKRQRLAIRRSLWIHSPPYT